MVRQSGNALFLILIAVALFAALSYAVTQSSRGSASATKEQLMIQAAQILDYAAEMQSAYQRLSITGGYDQVQLGYDEENPSGTCYNGNQPYTCRTIGMYAPSTGNNPPDIESLEDLSDNPNDWILVMMSSRLATSEGEIGSIAPDIMAEFRYLPKALCEAINIKLFDDPAIEYRVSVSGGDNGVSRRSLLRDGTMTEYTLSSEHRYYELPAESACQQDPANDKYHYTFILDQN